MHEATISIESQVNQLELEVQFEIDGEGELTEVSKALVITSNYRPHNFKEINLTELRFENMERIANALNDYIWNTNFLNDVKEEIELDRALMMHDEY